MQGFEGVQNDSMFAKIHRLYSNVFVDLGSCGNQVVRVFASKRPGLDLRSVARGKHLRNRDWNCVQSYHNGSNIETFASIPASVGQLTYQPDLFHILACEIALGMKDGNITDGQISASSSAPAPAGESVDYFEPHKGRLGIAKGLWCANTTDTEQWLKIDLKRLVKISGVGTQGDGTRWTTSYHVLYSLDDKTWFNYRKLDGSEVRSTNSYRIFFHTLEPLFSL